MAKYLLGIEIVGSQAKIAIIKKEKHLKLLGVDKIDVPLGDIAAETIRTWVGRNFKPGDELLGSISVSESSLFLEKIHIPSKSEESLDEAVYWELSSVLPFSISEAVYDWKISVEGDKTYAYIATVKTDYIENWVSLFQNAGIKIKLIEPSSVAFARLAKIDFSKRTLSLMVEENSTDLVILEDKIPIFSTSIDISVTRSDQDRRKLSKNVVDEIAGSAMKIVKYWEEKQGKKIEQATITGYIANKYFGLASAINKFLEVPVVIAKAKVIPNFSRTGFVDNGIEQNMVPIGSALGLSDEKLVLLNLLTYEGKKALNREKREIKRLSKISLFLRVNLLLLIIFAVNLFGLFLLKESFSKKLKDLENEVLVHPGRAYVQQTQDDNRLLSIIDGYFLRYENKTDRLNLLRDLTPSDLTFTSIEYKNVKDERWVIKGVGNRDGIIAFYEKLKEGANAKSITMPFSNFDKEENNDFEILITW
jgi:hypothetical protein